VGDAGSEVTLHMHRPLRDGIISYTVFVKSLFKGSFSTYLDVDGQLICTRGPSLKGGVPQKMLKGHLPRVIYHQVC